MKKVIGIVAVVAVMASAALAWDDVNRTISKLGVNQIDNPSSGTVTINDALVVNGAFAATSTNLVAGTTLNAVNGVNVTNISGANIKVSANPGFTGVITNGIGLAYTNRFCFFNGFCTNVYITGP